MYTYLDAHISSTHLVLLGVGAMSVYSGALKSSFMSWLLFILTFSICITSALIVLLKRMQWVFTESNLGWWCFDVFLDHHAAGGGSAVCLAVLGNETWCRD